MIDLKKLAERSPVASWIAFIFTILMAINGLISGTFDAYDKISSLFDSDSLIAVVGRVDFQSRKYDLVEVDFRNPTKETKTVSDVQVICTSRDGKGIRMFAANNIPKEWNTFRGIELTPVPIKPGESERLNFIFIKSDNIPSSLKECSAIQPVWTGTGFNEQRGDSVEIPEDAVTFTHTVLNRS